MAITTVDGMVSAARQAIPWTKTASATTVAAQWSTLLDVAGQPFELTRQQGTDPT